MVMVVIMTHLCISLLMQEWCSEHSMCAWKQFNTQNRKRKKKHIKRNKRTHNTTAHTQSHAVSHIMQANRHAPAHPRAVHTLSSP